MATFISDTFAGTGVITGHLPEDGYGAVAWVNDPTDGLTLTGGYAESITQSPDDSVGYASYGVADTDYGNGLDLHIEFVFKTGASVAGSDYGGFSMAVRVGGVDFSMGGYKLGGTWHYNYGIGDVTGAALVADTEYTVVMDVADGVQTASVNGESFGGAVAFIDSVGANRIDVMIGGGGFKLLSLTGTDEIVAATDTISITAAAPTPTVSMQTGMRIPITAPMPTVRMVMRDSTNAINIVMPMPTVEMRMGSRVEITAPTPTVQMAVTSTGTIRVNATAPMAQVGMVMTATGAISVQAQAPMATVEMRGGANVVAVAPMAQVAMEMTTGSVISITATAPMAEVGMRMSKGETISVEINVPMPVAGPWGRIVAVAPMAQVTMVMHTVVAVTFEAYAVNLRHDPRPGVEPIAEVTRYTNYPFNQIVRYQDKYYGVADTGLYELTGTTDYAATPTAIPWAFKTAMTDDKVDEKKTVRALRFSGRVGPAATVTLFSGESGNEAHAYTTPRDATPQNHREKLGRGIKGRYYAVAVAGDGVLNLDGLEPEVDQLTRKL